MLQRQCRVSRAWCFVEWCSLPASIRRCTSACLGCYLEGTSCHWGVVGSPRGSCSLCRFETSRRLIFRWNRVTNPEYSTDPQCCQDYSLWLTYTGWASWESHTHNLTPHSRHTLPCANRESQLTRNALLKTELALILLLWDIISDTGWWWSFRLVLVDLGLYNNLLCGFGESRWEVPSQRSGQPWWMVSTGLGKCLQVYDLETTRTDHRIKSSNLISSRRIQWPFWLRFGIVALFHLIVAAPAFRDLQGYLHLFHQGCFQRLILPLFDLMSKVTTRLRRGCQRRDCRPLQLGAELQASTSSLRHPP